MPAYIEVGGGPPYPPPPPEPWERGSSGSPYGSEGGGGGGCWSPPGPKRRRLAKGVYRHESRQLNDQEPETWRLTSFVPVTARVFLNMMLVRVERRETTGMTDADHLDDAAFAEAKRTPLIT